MSKCSVKGCNEESGGGTGVSFHILKKNEPEEVKELWKKFAKTSRVKSSFCICSRHFTPDDFITSEIYRKYYPNSKAKLKPGAVPTIPVENLPPQQTTKQVPPKVVVVKYTPNLQSEETTSDASCSTSVEMMDIENNLEIPETGSGINILEVKSTSSLMLEERSAQQRRNLENEKLELMKEIEEKTMELQRLQSIEEELTQLKGKTQILKKVKEHLQRQVTSLKSTNEQLMKIKQEKENMEDILLQTFSQNELDLLLKRKSHVAWKRKEIEEAFLIQYLSKPCYKYLRNKKRYPLPSRQIIQKWTNQHGIQLEVLNDIESDSD